MSSNTSYYDNVVTLPYADWSNVADTSSAVLTGSLFNLNQTITILMALPRGPNVDTSGGDILAHII